MGKFLCCLAALVFLCLPAKADCEPGYGLCSDGTCAPLGSVCCGGGRHCDAGQMCIEGNMCLDTQSDRVCSNGTNYCDEDTICTKENKCLPVASDRYCGGRRYCDEGYACVDKGSTCIPVQSARYCGNGNYCEEGFQCAANGKCAQVGGQADDTDTGGSSGGTGLAVSDSCLNISSVKVVSGLIGECSDKLVDKGHWNFVNVTSSRAQGCPKEIRFSAYDPGSGEISEWYTPFKLQTCGSPAQDIHTVPE